MGLVFILVVGFFVYYSRPFFHPGFFPTMDDVQVVRIDETLKELKSGQFPVRYIDTFGNQGGYMLFNYYSPLPYYVGATYQLLVTRPVKATKIVFLTAMFFGSVGTFFLLKKYTNSITSLLGVCLLLASSYLGYDIYLRGALAEVWGMMFFPWVIWSFLRVREKPTGVRICLAGLFYALAILSHIAIVAVLSLSLIFMVFIPPRNKKTSLNLVLSATLGLLLSAFFWLPLILERKLVVYQQSAYANEQYLMGFLSWTQLTGFSFDHTNLQATFGWGFFLLTLIGSLFLFVRLKDKKRPLFIYLFVVWLASLVFILPLAKPLWDLLPVLRYLQSPWRFLTVSTIFAVFICALALSQIKKWWLQTVIVGAVVAYAIIFQKGYLQPYAYNNIPEYKAEGVCGTTTWQDEYLPKWVKECIPREVSQSSSYPIFQATNVQAKNVSLQKNGRLITFNTRGKQGEIVVGKYYFPAWYLTIDGEKVAIHPSTKHGLITFNVPPGKHQIRLALGNTSVQALGNYLSLATGILVLAIFSFGSFLFWSPTNTLRNTQS